MKVEIRPCDEESVELLERCIPSPGRSRFHESRFQEHRSGRSTYLIAWSGGQPVGHLNLRWTGPGSPYIRRRYPDSPEINALAVWPAGMRGRGIGTALVLEAERRASLAGRRWIGLGVEVTNDGAQRLYERLGYGDSGAGLIHGSWTHVDHDGRRVVHHETIRYLVKELTAPSP